MSSPAARLGGAEHPFARYRQRFEQAHEPEQREAIAREAVDALGTLEAYALWLAALEAQAPAEDVVDMLREAIARGHTRFTETLRLRYPAYLADHEFAAWARDAQAADDVLAFAHELCARGQVDQAMVQLLGLCERPGRDPLAPPLQAGWGVDFTLMLLERLHVDEAMCLFAQFDAACRASERGDTVHFALTQELISVCPELDRLLVQAIASALRVHAPELAESALSAFATFAEPGEASAQAQLLRKRAPLLAELYECTLLASERS